MNLSETAAKHGIGWLLDPKDEHCHAAQLRAFAAEIAHRAAAEGWRSAVQTMHDSYNDQAPAELPDHTAELIVANVLVAGVGAESAR